MTPTGTMIPTVDALSAGTKMNSTSISLRVLAENTAARRSYEKAGFVQEGIFRDMELLDGQYRDVVFMARLAEKE